MTTANAIDYQALDDGELVSGILAGDAAATRLVISRNNQRLFRAAWGILKDRAEAEEAVQDAYLKAFGALAAFKGGIAHRLVQARRGVLRSRQIARKSSFDARLDGTHPGGEISFSLDCQHRMRPTSGRETSPREA